MPVGLLSLLIVGAGGAAGAIARYSLTLLATRFPHALPLGTLGSNVLGCLLMGVLVGILARFGPEAASGWGAEHHRLLFAVGFCGAFTTLSAFVFELSAYVQRGQIALASTYLLLTLLGGFASFYLGVLAARTFTSP